MLRQLLSFSWSFDRFFKVTKPSWMMLTTGSSWSGKQHCCFSCFAWPLWGRKPTRNTATFPSCSRNRYWWVLPAWSVVTGYTVVLVLGPRAASLAVTSHHITVATLIIFLTACKWVWPLISCQGLGGSKELMGWEHLSLVVREQVNTG